MKTAEVLVCCLLIFPLIGTVRSTGPDLGIPPLPVSRIRPAHRDSLEDLLRQGRELIESGQPAKAEKLFEILWKSAFEIGEYTLAARGRGNVGACQFALHRYHDAARSFLEAYRLAEQAGDPSVAALFEANLASLYSEMGELDSAVEWTERSLARVSGNDRLKHLASLEIQLASLRARQGRLSESMELFRKGIEDADRRRDVALYALGWNRLGEELMRRQEYATAEQAFLEAYRVRTLNRLPLEGSYTNLARVRLQTGDPDAAEALLHLAMERPDGPHSVPARDVYRLRGQVRLRQHRLMPALDDLRIAVRLERAWRWSGPAPDAARIGAEGVLADVHGALIEAGNRLYLQTGEPALIRETFEAAEENRANSLRLLLRSRHEDPDVPPHYWEAIDGLQRAELAALRDSAETRAAVQAARANLVRLEAERAPETAPLATDLLDRVPAALDPNTALLTFHVGETISWLWAVDRAGLELYPLPGRQEMQTLAASATDVIRDGMPAADDPAAALYRVLFGGLAPRFHQKARWLLALDTSLFSVPFAALVNDSSGQREYLIERHTTQVIPGAGAWLESQGHETSDRKRPFFLGIGDPIYNTADPRLPKRQPVDGKKLLLLPRLVGSRSEVESCARAWDGDYVLLTGAEANRAKLIEQLDRGPAVVHFATHFLESSDRSLSAMIPLGLTEVLPGPEISRWRLHAGLVVLSGCHSAAGAALPGTGLLGLTRAWLGAGAHSVIGSRWATPDEDGALFGALYRRLRAQAEMDSADGLRSAQLEMLRAGGWRAQPRYWGAYFAAGNQ